MPPSDRAAPAAEESLRGIVDALADDAEGLLRAELRLARAEIVDTVRRAAWLLAGAALAVIGLAYAVGFGLVVLIVWRGNHTLVAGIVAGAWLLVVLVGTAVAWRYRHLSPLALTRASLREDIEWAKAQTRRARP